MKSKNEKINQESKEPSDKFDELTQALYSLDYKIKRDLDFQNISEQLLKIVRDQIPSEFAKIRIYIIENRILKGLVLFVLLYLICKK